MKLYLDTSTPETVLKLNDQEYRYTFANDLAEKLLQFIHDKLQENGKTFQDITEITFMSGPGSFTGLRIGATVVNTLASELNIPLYNHRGEKHPIITPDYGRPANISKPRK
ncbi:tRNA (adenosine(37)-N6)-threonylcarbamoyltransferase complex dimerization subunit type 1 TsaB [Candidatus Nanosyncoccus alces]|uniref:tRNA threonylcarbamoyladenosine biosynthesis protein TsaB n=1 Tax=Candidatus Nanosyncoccus alces TaxID=2171997 RepID=A0ABY0FNN1_9BACT|nr:tRNA (adenosine(37)-N6)-threonylcarbamoyltransferase complex dimerization subunit type 1 TsaB [Candidatus Nanosyncoccus alces]RYC74858.1 tRNA threonylcarbamoyladenosine biosynthesis protein TsaB [Candidatus Nanosyncoccus alces]